MYKFFTLHLTAEYKKCTLHCTWLPGTNIVTGSSWFWCPVQKLYTAVMQFLPGTDTFLLHIQHTRYKFAPALFSSRQEGTKVPLTGKRHVQTLLNTHIFTYPEDCKYIQLRPTRFAFSCLLFSPILIQTRYKKLLCKVFAVWSRYSMLHNIWGLLWAKNAGEKDRFLPFDSYFLLFSRHWLFANSCLINFC